MSAKTAEEDRIEGDALQVLHNRLFATKTEDYAGPLIAGRFTRSIDDRTPITASEFEDAIATIDDESKPILRGIFSQIANPQKTNEIPQATKAAMIGIFHGDKKRAMDFFHQSAGRPPLPGMAATEDVLTPESILEPNTQIDALEGYTDHTNVTETQMRQMLSLFIDTIGVLTDYTNAELDQKDAATPSRSELERARRNIQKVRDMKLDGLDPKEIAAQMDTAYQLVTADQPQLYEVALNNARTRGAG